MKNIHKMIAFWLTLSASALAESGASAALNEEIVGISKTIGLVLFLLLIFAFIAVPIGSAFFSRSLAKKKAEQNSEESGGLTTAIWTLAGGVVGFFAVFIIIGFMGSMMDEDATDIKLVDGNRHVISKVLGSLLDNTEKSLSATQ